MKTHSFEHETTSVDHQKGRGMTQITIPTSSLQISHLEWEKKNNHGIKQVDPTKTSASHYFETEITSPLLMHRRLTM